MGKILLVHPINEDLRFLSKLVKRIKTERLLEYKHLKLSNNFKSHSVAQLAIASMCESDLLLVLCHGRPAGILGCSFKAEVGSHRNRYVYEESNGLFIDQSNAHILKEKKIVCVSCNSAEFGKKAIKAGASVFLGFKKIDFDIPAEGRRPSNNVAPKVKFILRRAIYWSIMYAKNNGFNFEQLCMLIKIYLNRHADLLYKEGKHRVDKRCRAYMTEKKAKSTKYYTNAAERLLEMSAGIEVLGNKHLLV